MEQMGPRTPLLIGGLNRDSFRILVRTGDPTLSAIYGNETNCPANDHPIYILGFHSANNGLSSLGF